MPEFVKIHPRDNVAVALKDIPAGTVYMGVAAAVRIPQGHKMALSVIAEGDQVVKYSFAIGHATEEILPGQWVHTHNMKTNLSGEETYSYDPKLSYPEPQTPGSFLGYRRRDGKVGIRNEIWILPTVG